MDSITEFRYEFMAEFIAELGRRRSLAGDLKQRC